MALRKTLIVAVYEVRTTWLRNVAKAERDKLQLLKHEYVEEWRGLVTLKTRNGN